MKRKEAMVMMMSMQCRKRKVGEKRRRMATQSSQPPPSSAKPVIPFHSLLSRGYLGFLKGLFSGNDDIRLGFVAVFRVC